MAWSKYSKWIKPMKRSQKAKLRKELEKRKQEAERNPDNSWLGGDMWVARF